MSAVFESALFKHLGQLGQGGTAQVAKVYSEKHNRVAALKYPFETSPDGKIDFALLAQREFDLIGDVGHSAVVRILDISTKTPEYLLLEYCAGPTLERVGRIENIGLALSIISAVAVNLEFLRARSIIHGDLKPDNIFLPLNWQSLDADRLFFIKLSDFSLGRFNHESDEQRAGMGTVGYMAPETLADSKTAHRSDLFALGVIAYQILTGCHPFMNGTSDPMEISSRTREENPTPIEQLRPELNAETVAVINSLLSKDESKRPVSGWETCRALKNAGVLYPFEKALRPAHLLTDRKDYINNIEKTLNLTDSQRSSLDLYTDGRMDKLRCLLTINFVRGNLAYQDGKFLFRNNVYIPHKMRVRALRAFSRASLAQKRLIVRAAVAGGIERAAKIGIAGPAGEFPSLLFELLRPLLRSATVRRLSGPMAEKAEAAEEFDMAARLNVQAGRLEDAERTAIEAAERFHKDSRYAEALRLLNKVIDLGTIMGRRADVRYTLMKQGDILRETGETDKAHDIYNEIVELYQDRPPDTLLGETYKVIGVIYKRKHRLVESLANLNKALEIHERLGSALELARVLTNIAATHVLNSDFSQAMATFRRALRTARSLKAHNLIAPILHNMGTANATFGFYRRAIRLFNLALPYQRVYANPTEIAGTLNDLGCTYGMSGDNERAIPILKEAVEIHKRIGAKRDLLFDLDSLTGVMIASGRLKNTVGYLREGLALSTELNNEVHEGQFSLAMGIVLSRTGKFSDAKSCLDRAESIASGTGDQQFAISVMIANAYRLCLLGNMEQALSKSEQALSEAERITNRPSILNAIIVSTMISADTERMQQGLTLADQLGVKREKLILQFNDIQGRLSTGDIDAALQLLQPVRKVLEELPSDIELPRMCCIAADCMIKSNLRDEARDFLKRGLSSATEGGLVVDMIRSMTLLGRIDMADGEYERCFVGYKKALQYAKKVAEGIADSEERNSFQSQELIAFLVMEIKRLSELMGQKKRADALPALNK